MAVFNFELVLMNVSVGENDTRDWRVGVSHLNGLGFVTQDNSNTKSQKDEEKKRGENMKFIWSF
jgi:hypothetical protein